MRYAAIAVSSVSPRTSTSNSSSDRISAFTLCPRRSVCEPSATRTASSASTSAGIHTNVGRSTDRRPRRCPRSGVRPGSPTHVAATSSVAAAEIAAAACAADDAVVTSASSTSARLVGRRRGRPSAHRRQRLVETLASVRNSRKSNSRLTSSAIRLHGEIVEIDVDRCVVVRAASARGSSGPAASCSVRFSRSLGVCSSTWAKMPSRPP